MPYTMDALLEERQALLAELQEKLGYGFRDRKNLLRALVHSSFAFEQGGSVGENNETLEFLGDAVLDLAVGWALFRRFPQMREGELTRLRAALVNEGHLAAMARAIGLGRHLLLGRGEDASHGRKKPSILSSAYEAVVGAVFLDGGYEAAREVVERQFEPWFQKPHEDMLLSDSKSALQEILQEKYNEAPVYTLEKAIGPDHDKTFFVAVRFRQTILGQGSAGSKKEAERQAAAAALKRLAAEEK